MIRSAVGVSRQDCVDKIEIGKEAGKLREDKKLGKNSFTFYGQIGSF